MKKSKTHCIIPDVQVKPGVNYDHLAWVGNYINEKRPDRIIQLGDFADMVSLNKFEVGKAMAEGKRYIEDIEVATDAMNKLVIPFEKDNYHPTMDLTLGNHEYRIVREVQSNPKFKGTLSIDNLLFKEYGWRVHKFLSPVTLDGIQYCHYFISGAMARSVGSAQALLRQVHGSAVMGHVQKIDLAFHPMTQEFAMFAGICYTHKEEYLTEQGNSCKPGIWFLHEVEHGRADVMFVSLGYLKKFYS